MQAFTSRNVHGDPLDECGRDPLTGFFRDGCCNTGHADQGIHTVCARVSEAFLAYSKEQGNDLTRGNPAMGFPGLRPGDRWCLCAGRWLEAHRAGVAPGVFLRATHEETLAIIPLAVLEPYALDEPGAG